MDECVHPYAVGALFPQSQDIQRGVEIFQDVFNGFDSYRDSDEAVSDSYRFAAFFSQRGVGHRGRMRNQRFHSAERFA